MACFSRYKDFVNSRVRGDEYPGYEEATRGMRLCWSTRVQESPGYKNVRGTRMSGVQECPGYKNVRSEGMPGYEGMP